MQLPQLTLDQIRCRCTEQSFERGLAYFHDGAIGNPVLHGWTLSATCRGSSAEPYRVTVELMPTGILSTDCSCLYSGHGDCKHSVALLHTYVEAPETICTIEQLLATLAGKPKSSLLHIISVLLKRTPALAPIAQVYADVPDTPLHTEQLPIAAIYKERIDRLFGDAFLEQHRLQQLLSQLEGLRTHAASLMALGETAFALAILYALIHQSIVRYPDTLQKGELPQFVSTCTKAFAQIATNAQHRSDIREYCRLLLDLSFDAAPVFIPHLTRLLEQHCLPQHTATSLNGGLMKVRIGGHMSNSCWRAIFTPDTRNVISVSPEMKAKVIVSYTRSLQTNKMLQRGKPSKRFRCRLMNTGVSWRVQSPNGSRISRINCSHTSDITRQKTAVLLYHKRIEAVLLSRKREHYEVAFGYLTALRALYQQLDQADQWCVYITRFRKQHARKRLLLQLLDERNFT